MKLIFALGNAELRYDGTRHNVGFAVIDRFARQEGISWNEKTKLKAAVAEIASGSEKIILAKPTTYYNLVGESYHAITNFYDITPEDVLIMHDDLALPFGTVRTRIGGSDGGSNGLKSLNTHGGEATNRLRIGIATPLREQIGDDAKFVLGAFSKSEIETLESSITPKAVECIKLFIDGKHEPTTHQVGE